MTEVVGSGLDTNELSWFERRYGNATLSIKLVQTKQWSRLTTAALRPQAVILSHKGDENRNFDEFLGGGSSFYTLL